MRFSKKFKIPHVQAELDFVDIDSALDLPLFFDPRVFTNEDDPFSVDCTANIQSYFGTLIEAIQKKRRPEAEELLSHLSEPNEICLGWSKGRPRGRGIGQLQAQDLYSSLARSQAARTGMISDLADCELFIDGIGPDKVSDITANIIRRQLIAYTQAQCDLHAVRDLHTVPMAGLWNAQKLCWEQDYFGLPVVGGRPILLVPKRVVRWLGDLSSQHQRYYRHFVLNFLKDENLKNNTSLVRVIKSKKGERRVVFKKDVEEKHPLSKDFLFRFSKDNPKVFSDYRRAYERTKGVDDRELDDSFDTAAFCDAVVKALAKLKPGSAAADEFHQLMVGTLEFIFYPDLSCPQKEAPIHGGRKRIDIRYQNSARDGFFHAVHAQRNITAIWIMVECKNYSSDPANPELDQLSGRFGANRGRLGLLIARQFVNRDLFLERCRDTAQDGRGFIIPLVDQDIIAMLSMIKEGRRSEINAYLGRVFGQLS